MEKKHQITGKQSQIKCMLSAGRAGLNGSGSISKDARVVLYPAEKPNTRAFYSETRQFDG